MRPASWKSRLPVAPLKVPKAAEPTTPLRLVKVGWLATLRQSASKTKRKRSGERLKVRRRLRSRLARLGAWRPKGAVRGAVPILLMKVQPVPVQALL